MRRYISKKIGRRIASGYLITCFLVLAVGVSALWRLSGITSQMEEINRELFLETTLLRDIAAKSVLARMYADAFISTQSQDSLNSFGRNLEELNRAFDQADTQVTNPRLREAVGAIRSSVKQYADGFTSMVEIIRKRQNAVQNILKVKTFLLENRLSAIRVNINIQSDSRVFLAFGNAQNSFLQMLLQTSEYLKRGDERHAVLFNKAAEQAAASFKELSTFIAVDRYVENAREAGEAVETYRNGFEAVRADYRKLNAMRANQMRALETRINKEVDGVTQAIKEQLNLHHDNTRLTLKTAANSLLAALVLTVAVSLTLGVVISRRITKPLENVASASAVIAEEDLKGLTVHLVSLSGGDLRAGFQVRARPLGLSQPDEVGRMAKNFDKIIYQLIEAQKGFAQLASYLDRMTQTAQAVARGDLDVEVRVLSERDRLGNAVAGMVAGLKKAEAELLDYQRRLEEMVSVRTAQLETLHRKFQDIIEFLPTAIFVVDEQGRVIAWNKAIENLTGVTKKEILGQAGDYSTFFYSKPHPLLIDFIKGQSSKRPDEFYENVERTPDGLTAEIYLNKARGGQGAYVWISAAPLFDAQGAMVGGIECLVDITERKRAEEQLADINRHLESLVTLRTKNLEERTRELEQANERLLELDRMKSAFVSLVSHELRTPLTSLLGFAKLIRRDIRGVVAPMTAGDEKAAAKTNRLVNNVDIILSEGGRLSRLINDVLDLSRIESGKMAWNDSEISIRTVIENSVEAMRSSIEANPDLRLELDVPSGLPPLFADKDRIMQVMTNLLSNAIKFTPKGVIRVSAKPAPGAKTEIEVSDTGVGVHPDELPEIFDRFRQAMPRDTLCDRPQGAGLGLAICRQIVEHYGGTIEARSVLGRGSAFRVVL